MGTGLTVRGAARNLYAFAETVGGSPWGVAQFWYAGVITWFNGCFVEARPPLSLVCKAFSNGC